MWHAAESLDFQTVFQILGTFEGFSIWKGARFFRGGGESAVDFDISDPIDTNVKARCAAVLNADSKKFESEIESIFWTMKKKKLRAFFIKCWFRICAWFWKGTRGLHGLLVFLLRVTPIITIPALSLSYIIQKGCTEKVFKGGEIVFWFIACKTVCYVLCWGCASLLQWHVNIKAPVADDGSIVPEKKQESTSPVAPIPGV